jgi:glycosyltransferase involved in cell wall biosynthesis
MQKKTVLYISYNSLTDQLAESQVLPYLFALSSEGYKFLIISCEHKNIASEKVNIIKAQCKNHNIDWYYIYQHTGFSLFSKFLDVRNIKALANKLFFKHKYSIVHCRSYVTSLAGLYIKKKFDVKFIFDSREFWANEQVENGNWNIKNPLYKLTYAYFKDKEKEFAHHASAIVNLSNNGKKIFTAWYPNTLNKIFVVPCVADFNIFKPIENVTKKNLRQTLNLPIDGEIITHLGALTPNYLLEETLALFKVWSQTNNNATLLFISKKQHKLIAHYVKKLNILPESVIIKTAERNNVNNYLNASDFALCLMIPCEAKKSASPIKIGEYAAVNLPVIATDVGDVEDIFSETDCGVVIKKFDSENYLTAISKVKKLKTSNIREKMKPYFNLDIGVSIYKKIYDNLSK